MRSRILVVVVLIAFGTGCITRAGRNLDSIEAQKPAMIGKFEHTIGNFAFTLDGGKMVTSTKAGRGFNKQILSRWEKRGYIASHEYVKSSAFSGQADFNLTLHGSQYGESPIGLQIISGLTLMLIPYTVDTKYDVLYEIEKVSTGEKFSAAVEDSFHTTVELLLILAVPFSMLGRNATMDVMADHLYEQLRQQGAFRSATEHAHRSSR